MIVPEEIAEMKYYIEKSKVGLELERFEEQLKILFALFNE